MCIGPQGALLLHLHKEEKAKKKKMEDGKDSVLNMASSKVSAFFRGLLLVKLISMVSQVIKSENEAEENSKRSRPSLVIGKESPR